jgi:hypothetical protein
VKLPQTHLPETQPGSSAAQPKTYWSTVLTATPIVLTVLATILAGLSSRELTLSQYHRALAAQNQSKAGDQWNLFQAKRSRRTNHENMVDLLATRTEAAQIDAAALEANTDFLLRRLRGADKDVGHLLQLLAKATSQLGAAGAALQSAATKLQHTVREVIEQVEADRKRVQELFAGKEVRSAWAYLNRNQQPQVEAQLPSGTWIQQAHQVVQRHQPEEETASLFRKIPENELRSALNTAEANVQAIEDAYTPISKVLEQIEQIVQEQVGLARRFQRATRGLEAAISDLPQGTGQPRSDIRATALALVRSGQAVKSAADQVHTDFKAAWHGYQARRYQAEAEYNRQAAEMYEIQVRQSGAFAERHRERSKDFFYGMLAAQAGVTIASFSLAMKHQSLLWGLAALAGLGAVVFGVYVHLYM